MSENKKFRVSVEVTARIGAVIEVDAIDMNAADEAGRKWALEQEYAISDLDGNRVAITESDIAVDLVEEIDQ